MTDKMTGKRAFNRKDHWESVYSEKQANEVSWYQQHPQCSLELIKATCIDSTARIIDIGGGASTLVDFLLDAGYENMSVLDISHAAIEQAKSRLGDRADKVAWFEQDITGGEVDALLAGGFFDMWHDRAVFHFLTDEHDQSIYVRTLASVLAPGAHAIIAAFDLEGPEKCSGLDIVRYSPETMSSVIGDAFQLVETSTEKHLTPGGYTQSFVFCCFKKR